MRALPRVPLDRLREHPTAGRLPVRQRPAHRPGFRRPFQSERPHTGSEPLEPVVVRLRARSRISRSRSNCRSSARRRKACCPKNLCQKERNSVTSYDIRETESGREGGGRRMPADPPDSSMPWPDAVARRSSSRRSPASLWRSQSRRDFSSVLSCRRAAGRACERRRGRA